MKAKCASFLFARHRRASLVATLTILCGGTSRAADPPAADPPLVKGADTPLRMLGPATLGMSLARLRKALPRSVWERKENQRTNFKRVTATRRPAKPGGDFEKLKFLVKDGKVISITGFFRRPADRKDAVAPWTRYKALAETYGRGSRNNRGQTRWVSTDGRTVAQLSSGGNRLSITDLFAAVKSGLVSKAEAHRAARRLMITEAVATAHGTTLELEPKARSGSPTRSPSGPSRTAGPRIPAWAIRIGEGAIIVQPSRNAVLAEGARTDFALGLTNIGGGNVSARRVELHLRTPGVGDWTRVARSNAPLLRPGFRESVTLSVNLSGRQGKPAGHYDGEIRIAGGDKSFPISVTIEPTSPNFTIVSMTVPPAEVRPGTNVEVTVRVKNNGTASQERVRVAIRAEGEPLGETFVRNEPVAPNETFDAVKSIRLPEPNSWGGSVRIKARVMSREDSWKDDNRASVVVRTPAPPPAPAQTGNKRISVTFTVDELECLEQDDGAVLGGDDEPYLFITGLHSRNHDRETRRMSFQDVSTEDDESVKPINVMAFDGVGTEIRPATGRQRMVSVTPYEWTGLHLSFWERDAGVDALVDPDLELPDEPSEDDGRTIGTNSTGYHIVNYATAHRHAGATTRHEAVFAGYGSRYVVRYTVTYGAAGAAPTDQEIAEHKFRREDESFSPDKWATGRGWLYDLRIGNLTDGAPDNAQEGTTVTLNFASGEGDKLERAPTGKFTGMVTIGRRGYPITTTVLLDWFFEFTVAGFDAGEAAQRFVGYLMREGDTDEKSKYRIVGTTWHGGMEQGFVMTMRAK